MVPSAFHGALMVPLAFYGALMVPSPCHMLEELWHSTISHDDKFFDAVALPASQLPKTIFRTTIMETPLAPYQCCKQAFCDHHINDAVELKTSFNRWYQIHYPERIAATKSRYYATHSFQAKQRAVLRRLRRGENVKVPTMSKYGIRYDKGLRDWVVDDVATDGNFRWA